MESSYISKIKICTLFGRHILGIVSSKLTYGGLGLTMMVFASLVVQMYCTLLYITAMYNWTLNDAFVFPKLNVTFYRNLYEYKVG